MLAFNSLNVIISKMATIKHSKAICIFPMENAGE